MIDQKTEAAAAAGSGYAGPACSTCRFFDRFYESCASGLCRRYPPRILGKGDDGDWIANWPQVDDADGCGEHQPLNTTPKSNSPGKDA